MWVLGLFRVFVTRWKLFSRFGWVAVVGFGVFRLFSGSGWIGMVGLGVGSGVLKPFSEFG